MVELATAYISIVPDASQIPRAVKSALGQAEGQARQSGQRMGSTMSTALGTALGIGASKAVGAATSAISTALSAGFDRLNAIDQAKGKLAGLGNSTQTTARVMDSALASVKGTAFGLGDAATIAASAIAAGIKPGQDLTKYLSMTADAATIAGSSLGDMGSILNGVQTSGNAMNDSLGQLADRGIPIYQWLGEEMGVTAGEVEDLASKGKVSSEVFFAAIQKNIGGAALESGKTVQGSFNNVKAALGRLGAAVEEPGFTRLPGFFTDLTARIDAFTPKAKEMALAFDSKVFDEWGPKIQDALAAFEKTGSIDEFKTTLKGLADALVGAGPAVAGIASSLAQASAALGVSGWQLFLTALQAAAGVLNAINPLLSGLSSLMQSNQVAVTALVAAWFAFKTIPAIMGRVTTSLAPMGGALASARTSVSGFGSAWRTSIGYMQQANPAMSTFGAGVRVLGANAGAAAKGGLGMLRNAGSAVAGVFGGPVGLGLTAAAVGFTYVSSQIQKADQATRNYVSATRDLVEAQHAVGTALITSGGAVNDNVLKASANAMDSYRQKLEATEATYQSTWTALTSRPWGDWINPWADSNSGAAVSNQNQLAEQAKRTKAALDQLGMSNDELSKRITGSATSYDDLRRKLLAMGTDGRQAASDIAKLRSEFLRQQSAARTVVPGITQLGDAIRTMSDDSASAGDKLNALKAAMDAMNPARNQTEALAQYGETIRKVADAAAGIDSSAIGDNGQINAMSEAGATLSRTLGDLADKSAQVASTGGDMAEVNRQNEQAFQALADATGQPIAKIRELYSEMGGRTVDLSVELEGAPDVLQRLAEVQTAFNKSGGKKKVELEPSEVTEQTKKMLESIGFTVQTMPNGNVSVTAKTDEAQAKLALLTQNVSVINALKANPSIDLNTLPFTIKDQQARATLQQLATTEVDPRVGAVIQDLLNGHAVSMSKLDELSRSTANPNVVLKIEELLANAGIANSTLDNAARTRTATINVVAQTNAAQLNSGFGMNMFPNADGMIRQYATGGINTLEQYANGKLPNQAVVQKAMPHSLIQWAEPETGGEAFIPLAGSKRSRSTDILAAVAKIFGYALVPQDNLPSTVSGMLGSLTGNALSRMLSLTGVDKLGVTAYANGGMDAAGLRKLAEGTGASRPLTGAPYVWGGVNWGDCSGAMSAFARAAVGLDPFGGRFATASEGSQLQSMGFTLGQGSSGDLRFGWYNGGAGGGHTAGTLPDGTNIEMGGGNGGGMLGGSAAGADSPQFTDHAFLTIGPGLPTTGTGATDPGGFVTRPDGTIVYQPGNGNYGATGSDTGSGSGSTTGSSGTSISSRFGSAVGAFVEGQIADVFQTLGANDSPGIVGAIADYENAQRAKQNGQGVDTAALKKSYDDAVAKSNQQFDKDKAQIDEDLKTRKINQAEHDQKIADLTKKHEDTLNQAKQKYDEASKTANSANSAAGQQDQQNPVTDPGTSKPAPGQDLGGAGGAAAALASTGNQIKAPVRSGLREAWRSGQPWTDTDYIVGKESGWKVDATNPSSGAFGLGQWNPSSGTLQKYLPDKSTDPAVQGKAFDRYVGDVYTDPMGARSHWDQYGWYDRGGIIHEGTTLMRNELGHKETALPFDPRDLKASLDRGGNNDALIAEIRALRSDIKAMGRGGVTVNGGINGMSPEAAQRRLQDMQRRQMMRASQ